MESAKAVKKLTSVNYDGIVFECFGYMLKNTPRVVCKRPPPPSSDREQAAQVEYEAEAWSALQGAPKRRSRKGKNKK